MDTLFLIGLFIVFSIIALIRDRYNQSKSY
jgi:hypothetical protein